MVNEEILGALNSALARGESLKKAMMTLYNAGYKKEEISEASRSVQQVAPATQPKTPQQPATQQPKQPLQQPTTQQPIDAQMLAPSKELAPKGEQPQQPIQQQIPPQQAQPQQVPPQQAQQQTPGAQTPQRVSGYGQPPKPAGKTIIIILGFLLLLLVGILVTIFLFKEELINFFNNLFN